MHLKVVMQLELELQLLVQVQQEQQQERQLLGLVRLVQGERLALVPQVRNFHR
jgi:hypothetical protein